MGKAKEKKDCSGIKSFKLHMRQACWQESKDSDLESAARVESVHKTCVEEHRGEAA